MKDLSRNNRSRKEVEKHSRGSWRPDTKFRQEKLLQPKLIQWKCPPKISMPDEWRIVAGEESVELEVQKQREKGVAEEVYVHRHSIPPNPSVVLDLEEQSQDDSCIYHVPIEEVEEGEMLHPCKTCASSKAVAKESTSIPANTGSQIDPEIVGAIATLARSVQNDLIDPHLLTRFLNNPQMFEEQMKGGLGTGHATEKMPKPNPLALSLPNMRATNNAQVQQSSSSMPISNEYGAHQSMGDKPIRRPEYSISGKMNPAVPPCKFFNTSKGCWNGSKCRFWHDAKRRKLA